MPLPPLPKRAGDLLQANPGLSEEEHKDLECQWDSRHYVIRARSFDALAPVLMQGESAVWSSHSSLGQTSNSRLSSSQTFRLSKKMLQRAPWDEHHHITHSAANNLSHDCTREYFSRFVEARSKRVVPKKRHGLTMHYFAHQSPDRRDGGLDDPPTTAEMLLSEARGVPLPVAPGRFQLKALAQKTAASEHAEGS